MSCGTIRPAALETPEEIEMMAFIYLIGPEGLRFHEPDLERMLQSDELGTRQLAIQMLLQDGEPPDQLAVAVALLAMAGLREDWDNAVGMASLRPEDLPS